MIDIFNENNLNPHIDSIKLKMDPLRIGDPLASLDYGYYFNDYENSFVQYSSGHVKYGIKEYITERKNAVLDQLDLQNIEPIITELENNSPNLTQDIAINASVEDDNDLASVEVHYQILGQPNVEIAAMFDDGMHNDGAAADGVFGAILPPAGSGGELNYFVKVVDDTGLENRLPKCIEKTIFIGNSDLPLYVNEIMASNNNTFADDAGEYDDWIEIYNGGIDPIYLGNKYLSDNPSSPDKWQMPDVSIQPGEFLIFWADKDEIQGDNHTNFKLSASGEYIGIFDAASNNFALIDGYEFGEVETDQSLARWPDGTGIFQVLEPTPGASNMTVGLDFFIKKLEVNVFPNPVKDVFNIVLENENNQSWNIELLDQLGRVVFEQNDLEGETYSFSFLEKKLGVGIYFLKIEMENGDFWTGKVSVF